MGSTVQTAVETLYGSSDFAVFFDDTLMNDLVISFSTNSYVNGIASSATINCIYSEALYKIKNYDSDGNLKKEMHGIDYMTNVKIFVKNAVNNLYYMVFDGNLTGKSLTKSNEGNVSLSFSAEDYMHYLDKTVVPIAVPIGAMFNSSDRLKWKAQGIDIDAVPKYQNEATRSLRDKNIKELVDESVKISFSNNAFFTDKEGVTYWDAPTDRIKVMGDVSEKLREAKIIDYIVTSDGTSVSSLYVMIGSIANSLMFEFFQDRDGVIRVKPPFWNEGVLKDHIIMPSFVSSYEESTDFTKMYTRVVTQGSIDPSINSSAEMKNYLMPVGCYVAGDDDQLGIWMSYTSETDPYTNPDKLQAAIQNLIDANVNASAGTVYGTSGTPVGTGEKKWNSSTESYRPLVTKICAKWGMSPVVEIVLAMIQQESSGGTGKNGYPDVMQAREGAYGKNISTPEDSINAGVQEFRDALNRANGDVAIALQTYNYGPRFITYVKDNGGVYTLAIADAFSEMMKQKFSDQFPKVYGDKLYVPHVMQYVPAGAPTNYLPTSGFTSNAGPGDGGPGEYAGTGGTGAWGIPGVPAPPNAANEALKLNYIQSSIFYNTMQRNADLSQRQLFSLPSFGGSSVNGLLGRQNLFTTGNVHFNPLLWGLDADIIDLLNLSQESVYLGASAGAWAGAPGWVGASDGGGGEYLGFGGGGNQGVAASGKRIGYASVTENIYNIGRANLSKRQGTGIKAKAGCYIDCRQYSTSDLLAVARQYLGIPYVLGGNGKKSGLLDKKGNPGYDCASFVWSVYSHFGIQLGTYVRAINSPAHGELGGISVKPVAFESLVPGDLCISPQNKHVVIYAGNGMKYHAPKPGKQIELVRFNKKDFDKIGIIAIRRPAMFRDTPGSGISTNVGPSTPVPAITAPESADLPKAIYSPTIFPNGIQSVIDQNMDLLTGKTSIEGTASVFGFLGGSKMNSDGTPRGQSKDSLHPGSPYSAAATRSATNINTQEGSLLWQSNAERRYGANILNIDQPLIRGYDVFEQIMTQDGPAGSISDALRSYSIFMHGLTNGLVETATLATTAPMPWLRCGMNCWVDPMGIDKIFYINGIKHSGSAKEGVSTELSLGYGRTRYQYLNETNKFGSLRTKWKDNVFVSKIYDGYSIDAFGEVIDQSAGFSAIKTAIEKNYEIAGKDGFAFSEPKSIDNVSLYKDLYGGISTDTSGRDSIDTSVLDPKGEILIRTADGTIITGSQAVKIREEERAAANPSSSSPSSGKINDSTGTSDSNSGSIKKWADGSGFPSGVTYEDKKALKYLAWLETMPTLRYGDNGTQVKRLQNILYYLGLAIMQTSSINGNFGALTRKGVMILQGTFGLSKTGVLKSNEISKLKSLLKNLLSNKAKSAYSSALGSSQAPASNAPSKPILDSLSTKDSPLSGPVYQKSGDLYDYSPTKGSRSTKRMLLSAYSLTVIRDSLEKNYDQSYPIIRDRRDNVRKTFKRAMDEINTRSPMMKFKPN